MIFTLRNFLVLGLIAILITFFGCAVPGSSFGVLKAKGLVSEYQQEEKPLTVKLLLPREYGLGGLDHAFVDPEDYGHYDRTEIIEIDDEGAFSFEQEIVYHATFFPA